MNKLSGYKAFKLQDGTTVELKFCNGTYEIFADLMGLENLEDIEAALTPPTKEVIGEGGKSTLVPQMTLGYMKAFRNFVLAAALYVARVQNKPEDFNEWTVSEWIEELGYEGIMSAMEKPVETKKKPIIKATQ